MNIAQNFHFLKAFVIAAVMMAFSASAQDRYVDYRFAPQWQESTTAFPNDNCKTLVGPQGQLFYRFGGPFFPMIGQGFGTVIHMMADENQKFENAKLMDARTPVIILESTMKGSAVTQSVFSTCEDIRKHQSISCPFASNREDVILTTIMNDSSKPKTFHPIVVVNSSDSVKVSGNVITIGEKTHFVTSVPSVRVRNNLVSFKTIIELEDVLVNPGAEFKIFGVYDNGFSSTLTEDCTLARIEEAYDCTVRWWQTESNIPYGHIIVPDKEIQNLIDASIRGIWQAREIIDGKICLQVGPTCYRGLWIVDGAFLSEATTLVGCGKDARAGIEYSLSFQRPDGGFTKLAPRFWKENGLILWTCVRHAMLTQDKEWLLKQWDKLSRTVDFIQVLRDSTYLNNIPEDDGLIPPGNIDGGLAGGIDQPEYSNTLWCLAGLKSVIGAGEWLGKDVSAWKLMYDDFFGCFKKASQRDAVIDEFGNLYLNDVMRESQRDLPQRAQWAFCQSVYPGQVFDIDDPIANGTIDMLETTLQEGMVVGTGWITEGLWNYFASFYGHAQLWLGNGDKAANSLYAFANHASTMFNWREEHNPRDLHSSYVGDMPHNWASAEFIRLATHLLQIDRGNTLHLLEGLPEEWIGPEMTTEINEMPTPFGPLSFTLKISKDGRYADMAVKALKDNCTDLYVHCNGWGTINGDSIARLTPTKYNKIRIELTVAD